MGAWIVLALVLVGWSDGARADAGRLAAVRLDPVRGDEVRGGEVRGGEVRGGEVRGDEVRGDEVRGDEVRADEVRGDEVRGDAVRADAGLIGAGSTEPLEAGEPPRVVVDVLEKYLPHWMRLDGPRRLLVRAGAAGLEVEGALVETLSLPAGRWRLRGTDFDRSFDGAIRLAAAGGVIAARIEMPLERYVAAVVAAESAPETPPAALRALAIVVRSYAVAARGRHDGGALCDLAHCQVMAGAATSAAAIAATRATAGQVLRVEGAVAAAPFHAACGGHTGDPGELFGGADRSGAAAVADAFCAQAPWSADIGRELARQTAGELLGAPDAIDRLRVIRGSGGYVVAVIDPASGRQARGEAFARALDRASGWSVVRSPRFDLQPLVDSIRIAGGGHGHGAGLCQAGAARRAEAGHDHPAILAHYFPGARLGRLAENEARARPD